MSYSVAAIVTPQVTITASSAQVAHHGQDSRRVSSLFSMTAPPLPEYARFVE
jgi:hypothetical protein